MLICFVFFVCDFGFVGCVWFGSLVWLGVFVFWIAGVLVFAFYGGFWLILVLLVWGWWCLVDCLDYCVCLLLLIVIYMCAVFVLLGYAFADCFVVVVLCWFVC